MGSSRNKVAVQLANNRAIKNVFFSKQLFECALTLIFTFIFPKKKLKAKKKAKYGWVFTEKKVQNAKATPVVKKAVEEKMQPLIERLKKNIVPLQEPQKWNQVIDIYGKWYRNFYYIYQIYQCPPDSTKDKFEVGLARMKYVGNESFDLSYFRHTGQWFPLPMHASISVEECIKSIENDPWFLG